MCLLETGHLRERTMHTFDELFEISAKRHGGKPALNKLLEPPKTPAQLRRVKDDRWLANMTKCIFQAGFNWKVVESMWPGFEEAFNGFDIGRCLMMNDDDIARLVSDKRIVRHGAKISAVQQNAAFLSELAKEHGTAAKAFADWPPEDYIGLLDMIKKRGMRLGGNTGQYFLRFSGKDSFILSRDVTTRLMAEGVIDKPASSRSAMAAVQEAFNTWMHQSGRSLKEISRVLAMSID